MSELPDGWEQTTLGEIIATSTLGGNYKTTAEPNDRALVKMGNMQRGYIDIEGIEYLAQDVEPESVHELHADDVILNTRNTPELVGKVSMWRRELPTAYFNNNILRLRPHQNAIEAPAYFNALLNTDDAIAEIRRSAIGTTSVAAIYSRDLKPIEVHLPPKSEQAAIAEVLTDADEAISATARLIEKKRAVRQGAAQALLSGDVRLPGFEGDWDWHSIGQMFKFLRTSTNPRSDITDDGDSYYLHYGDIHTRYDTYVFLERGTLPRIDGELCGAATVVRDSDWIIADASEDPDGIAKAVEVRGETSAIRLFSGLHTFLLRDTSMSFAGGFKGLLRSVPRVEEQLLRAATGMKVFGVSKTALRNIEIPVPQKGEQAAIVAVLTDMDDEIIALDAKLEKLRLLKTGLMQELLTGRTRLV